MTETEWNEAMPIVTRQMRDFIREYRTPLVEHKIEEEGDYGELLGSGAFVDLLGQIYILTNEHNARKREKGAILGFSLLEDDRIVQVIGNHLSDPHPKDLAVLPVSLAAWSVSENKSKAIVDHQLNPTHSPVSGELLAFTGFSMDNSRFSFGGMVSEGTCYIGRETPCPMHKDVDPSFHFAIEYLPDRTEILDSDRPAPRPNGFSGSIVWDTGFVRCHQEGLEWNPNMAKVTGVVWGWPSSHGVIVATKIEHIHPFLEVAKSQILAQL